MCGTFELFDLFSVFVVIPCCFLHSKYAYLFVKVYTVGAVYTLDFFLLPTLQRLAVFISLLFFFLAGQALEVPGLEPERQGVFREGPGLAGKNPRIS